MIGKVHILMVMVGCQSYLALAMKIKLFQEARALKSHSLYSLKIISGQRENFEILAFSEGQRALKSDGLFARI